MTILGVPYRPTICANAMSEYWSGLLNILRVVPEEVPLPKAPGSTEVVVYFPRVSPDWTKFAYLYSDNAYMGNTNTFGFRVVSLEDLTQPPVTVTGMCKEENGIFHGIQGFNHTLHGYSWLGNDLLLATTFFYNTTEIFEIRISTKEVTRITKDKKYLGSEAQYVIGPIDENHILVRRDCIYKNNLFHRVPNLNLKTTHLKQPLNFRYFHILYKDELGAYKEIPLYKDLQPGYKVWEKLVVIDGVQAKVILNYVEATFYGKVDEALPNSERGLIIWIHGGPHANWVNTFHPFFQYFIHKGHNVINVNYTGSTGRGEQFCENLHAKSSTQDAKEIAGFVKHLIENKEVDPKKVRTFLPIIGFESRY